MRGRIHLWEGLPDVTRRDLLAIWRDLQDEHGGVTRRVARRYLKSTVELWYVTDAVSEEAAKLAGKRRHARGRTSTLKKVQWAAKRQALQMTSLDTALSKLKALSAGPALTLARRRQA